MAGDWPALTSIDEVDPDAAFARQRVGALLVDVRDAAERSLAYPAGSIGLALAALEGGDETGLPDDPAVELLLICASGRRSLRAAELLRARGRRKVASVAGGLLAWRAAALPVDDAELMDARMRERYDRHWRLPEFGVAGQQRLATARVALIGAGGLGSPAALYLAAAGVGRLRLVDDDRVELSNLQRQVLHGESRLGERKVDSGQERLRDLNSDIAIEALPQRLDGGNVDALLHDCDLVIDGSDNLATRYLIADRARALGLPWVYGAVQRFAGQVSLFAPDRGPCFRCLFPDSPPAGAMPGCAEAGVLGVVPGLVGLVQATEAIKWLAGIGEPLVGRLLRIDAWTMRFSETTLPRDPDCPGCGRSGALQATAP